MDRPLIVLDTERATATGAPHLLELGAVRIEDGEVVDHFCSLVCPDVPIDPATSEVHGIEESDVLTAPDAATVLNNFLSWAGDEWFAAHDAPSDARVLGFECARAGIEPPRSPFIDSLPLSQALITESPDHSLQTLVETLALESDGAHRALADSVHCWQVLEECIVRLERKLTAPEGGDQSSPLNAALAAEATVTAASLLKHSKRTPRIGLPARPTRFPRRLRPIEKAIEDGAGISFIYGADGQSSRLSVQPRVLYQMREHGYLEALCDRAGILKTYRLDRIQRVLA